MNSTYQIQEASEQDASLLTSIAMKSKQHWGYPDEWMELWREDLKVTADMLNRHKTWKIGNAETTMGFVIIIEEDSVFEIEHCFIHPDHIGKGLGSMLLKEVLSRKEYQSKPFKVLADPNAVPFYEKFGFDTFTELPSKPEGRTLPYMKMTNTLEGV